ncbi:hypothetical protein MKW92_008573, partial [Papaver armeniacum]
MRGEVSMFRRSSSDSFRLPAITSFELINHPLLKIQSLAHQLENNGQNNEISIALVVSLTKEVIAGFNGGERVMIIEVIKKLLVATLSPLSMPIGKQGFYQSILVEIVNLCDGLLRMQRRGSEDLPYSGKDYIISTLGETLKAQGLIGIPPGLIKPRRQIVNMVSRDQPNPARHSSGDEKLQRKSEGDENKNICTICLEVIKDEKDEK